MVEWLCSLRIFLRSCDFAPEYINHTLLACGAFAWRTDKNRKCVYFVEKWMFSREKLVFIYECILM